MKKTLIALFAFTMCIFAGGGSVLAQSLDDLNIQIHGYATQGFLYTTQDNWNSITSTDGSPAWSEAVFNVTAQPSQKLRVGAQVRYFILGTYGNKITLDWASGDYRINEKLGLRFGKVKSPNGLFNDIQDIDPAFIWCLLPQTAYPISSRTSILAHYGAVAYGNFRMGKKAGKLEYQIYGGERVLPSDDGFFVPFIQAGTNFPSGLNGPTGGGTLRWKTPVEGLMLGGAIDRENLKGQITIPAAGLSANIIGKRFYIPFAFAKYEHHNVMVAGEWSRTPFVSQSVFSVGPPGVQSSRNDHREWYAMATYKFTDKLTAGTYYSSYFDKQLALGPGRFQKDWTVSGRYDFNPFLYLKAEQHFIDGTAIGYLIADNTNMKPDNRLSILKIGVSF